MVARPGRLQAAFTAGEIDELIHERTELKYFSTGAKHMENVVISPQGGFRNRGGLRDVGAVASDAARLFSFTASDGADYDLVFRPAEMSAWSATAKLQDVAITGLTAAMLPEMSEAQWLDTMLLFHNDLQTRRIKHAGASSWSTDNAPYSDLPNYDYGGPIGGGSYVNGIAATWQLEFTGLTEAATVFTITVSGQQTKGITYTEVLATLEARVSAALAELANVSPGYGITSSGGPKINIIFSGAGNEGDGWAVSATVVNKADAAITAHKSATGVPPGEAVISTDRGWPNCGAFYNQRLLVGGFKSLPNTWMYSRTGDYYNYDIRFESASGPALIPMNLPGGEKIERFVPSRNLAIFTSRAEYWLAERGLSQSDAPNHVQASQRGTRRGVPIVENEGALLFPNKDGGVIGEYRYTDVEGNFVSRDISLLAAHLTTDVIDQAVKRATKSTDGNQLGIVQGDGSARIATILREQDVTAFCRATTDGTFKAVSVNGRNELMWIVQRPDSRRLERLDNNYLLDEATDFDLGAPGTIIGNLTRFNGREIWVIGDNEVFGPMTVAGGSVTLPVAVTSGYVGTWKTPKVTTLPPPRDIGPKIVLKRPARIHSVHISVIDTTSLAIASNDGELRDVPLHRYGVAAEVAELLQPVTGTITVRGLRGIAMEPTVTIGQLRPGKLNVRSVVVEASL